MKQLPDTLSTPVAAELLRRARAAIHLHFDPPLPLAERLDSAGTTVERAASSPLPGAAQQELEQILSLHCGIFVTLKIGGQLRGCIGRIISSTPLAELLPQIARESAFMDRRFSPLAREEAERCSISISLLSPPFPLKSAEDFMPGEMGIILQSPRGSAVFLPEVATEQGWDRETTLRHLGIKAGLGEGAWERRDSRFECFTSLHISESRLP